MDAFNSTISLGALPNHRKSNSKPDESDFEYITQSMSDVGSAHKKSQASLEASPNTR